MTILIHGPPQIVACAMDREEYFIQVPFVARTGSSAMELIRILLPELPAPLADGFDGFIRDDDPTDEQELFYISVAETEWVVGYASSLHRHIYLHEESTLLAQRDVFM